MSLAMAEQPKNTAALADEKSLVYGLGASGLSVARYLRRKDAAAAFIDSRAAPPGLDELRALEPDADIVLGEAPAGFLERFDRIIVSPGIADRDPLLRAARRAGIEIVTDIDLFVAAGKVPFAAVTGSNGKSTVATLLALMCRASGLSARAGANLGEPALDLLRDGKLEFCVLELSSFQLHRCCSLPAQVAVLLNISPDHLDWHESEQEYRAAKYRIFREASAAVWNRADPQAEQHIASATRTISFGLDSPQPNQYGVLKRDGTTFLARGDQCLMPTSQLALVGKHNQANALAALAAGEIIGLDAAAMLRVLYEFRGLPHRMQSVRSVAGVEYINDSKATNVGAAVSSVESIDGPVVLIAGGQGKGGDFAALAEAVYERLRAAILIGEDAPLLAAAFAGLTTVYRVDDMRSAVRQAASIASAGDTVLLAPACASFDQFENFQKRGDSFCSAVQEIGA
jgi:UDP-N-acetylmuramoylalanine--D-glutamate ligase